MERHLSRRERQIMDVVYQRGEATAADVIAALPDPPSYSSVRALLRTLEHKGHLDHRREWPRYVFFPTRARREARLSALARVLRTFFRNAPPSTAAAFIDDTSLAELDEHIQNWVDQRTDRARPTKKT